MLAPGKNEAKNTSRCLFLNPLFHHKPSLLPAQTDLALQSKPAADGGSWGSLTARLAGGFRHHVGQPLPLPARHLPLAAQGPR